MTTLIIIFIFLREAEVNLENQNTLKEEIQRKSTDTWDSIISYILQFSSEKPNVRYVHKGITNFMSYRRTEKKEKEKKERKVYSFVLGAIKFLMMLLTFFFMLSY